MSENQPEGYMDEGLQETVEDPAVGEPFTDAEIQDFIDRGGEAPAYHPLLKVWRELLSNAPDELGKRVTPQWANRVTSSYRELNFADMERFRDSYFGKLMELASTLETVIDSDEDCLTYSTPEDDVEHNSRHYKDLLIHWQIQLLGWELDWECTSPDAAIEIAAISEVHKMFFGTPSQQGLVAYLENIRFEYTEADQEELAEALAEAREGR